MISEETCYLCSTPLRQLPPEDRDFSVMIGITAEAICRGCMKDYIMNGMKRGVVFSDTVLKDPHFASVILEAYSEVIPT